MDLYDNVSNDENSNSLEFNKFCELNLFEDFLVEQHNEKDGNKLLEASKEIEKLKEKLLKVEKENETLMFNISSLWKTALAQMKEKNFIIKEMQRKYDSLIFKRGIRQVSKDDFDSVLSRFAALSKDEVFELIQVLKSSNTEPINTNHSTNNKTFERKTRFVVKKSSRIHNEILGNMVHPEEKIARELGKISGYQNEKFKTRVKREVDNKYIDRRRTRSGLKRSRESLREQKRETSFKESCNFKRKKNFYCDDKKTYSPQSPEPEKHQVQKLNKSPNRTEKYNEINENEKNVQNNKVEHANNEREHPNIEGIENEILSWDLNNKRAFQKTCTSIDDIIQRGNYTSYSIPKKSRSSEEDNSGLLKHTKAKCSNNSPYKSALRDRNDLKSDLKKRIGNRKSRSRSKSQTKDVSNHRKLRNRLSEQCNRSERFKRRSRSRDRIENRRKRSSKDNVSSESKCRSKSNERSKSKESRTSSRLKRRSRSHSRDRLKNKKHSYRERKQERREVDRRTRRSSPPRRFHERRGIKSSSVAISNRLSRERSLRHLSQRRKISFSNRRGIGFKLTPRKKVVTPRKKKEYTPKKYSKASNKSLNGSIHEIISSKINNAKSFLDFDSLSENKDLKVYEEKLDDGERMIVENKKVNNCDFKNEKGGEYDSINMKVSNCDSKNEKTDECDSINKILNKCDSKNKKAARCDFEKEEGEISDDSTEEQEVRKINYKKNDNDNVKASNNGENNSESEKLFKCSTYITESRTVAASAPQSLTLSKEKFQTKSIFSSSESSSENCAESYKECTESKEISTTSPTVPKLVDKPNRIFHEIRNTISILNEGEELRSLSKVSPNEISFKETKENDCSNEELDILNDKNENVKTITDICSKSKKEKLHNSTNLHFSKDVFLNFRKMHNLSNFGSLTKRTVISDASKIEEVDVKICSNKPPMHNESTVPKMITEDAACLISSENAPNCPQNSILKSKEAESPKKLDDQRKIKNSPIKENKSSLSNKNCDAVDKVIKHKTLNTYSDHSLSIRENTSDTNFMQSMFNYMRSDINLLSPVPDTNAAFEAVQVFDNCSSNALHFSYSSNFDEKIRQNSLNASHSVAFNHSASDLEELYKKIKENNLKVNNSLSVFKGEDSEMSLLQFLSTDSLSKSTNVSTKAIENIEMYIPNEAIVTENHLSTTKISEDQEKHNLECKRIKEGTSPENKTDNVKVNNLNGLPISPIILASAEETKSKNNCPNIATSTPIPQSFKGLVRNSMTDEHNKKNTDVFTFNNKKSISGSGMCAENNFSSSSVAAKTSENSSAKPKKRVPFETLSTKVSGDYSSNKGNFGFAGPFIKALDNFEEGEWKSVFHKFSQDSVESKSELAQNSNIDFTSVLNYKSSRSKNFNNSKSPKKSKKLVTPEKSENRASPVKLKNQGFSKKTNNEAETPRKSESHLENSDKTHSSYCNSNCSCSSSSSSSDSSSSSSSSSSNSQDSKKFESSKNLRYENSKDENSLMNLIAEAGIVIKDQSPCKKFNVSCTPKKASLSTDEHDFAIKAPKQPLRHSPVKKSFTSCLGKKNSSPHKKVMISPIKKIIPPRRTSPRKKVTPKKTVVISPIKLGTRKSLRNTRSPKKPVTFPTNVTAHSKSTLRNTSRGRLTSPIKATVNSGSKLTSKNSFSPSSNSNCSNQSYKKGRRIKPTPVIDTNLNENSIFDPNPKVQCDSRKLNHINRKKPNLNAFSNFNEMLEASIKDPSLFDYPPETPGNFLQLDVDSEAPEERCYPKHQAESDLKSRSYEYRKSEKYLLKWKLIPIDPFSIPRVKSYAPVLMLKNYPKATPLRYVADYDLTGVFNDSSDLNSRSPIQDRKTLEDERSKVNVKIRETPVHNLKTSNLTSALDKNVKVGNNSSVSLKENDLTSLFRKKKCDTNSIVKETKHKKIKIIPSVNINETANNEVAIVVKESERREYDLDTVVKKSNKLALGLEKSERMCDKIGNTKSAKVDKIADHNPISLNSVEESDIKSILSDFNATQNDKKAESYFRSRNKCITPKKEVSSKNEITTPRMKASMSRNRLTKTSSSKITRSSPICSTPNSKKIPFSSESIRNSPRRAIQNSQNVRNNPRSNTSKEEKESLLPKINGTECSLGQNDSKSKIVSDQRGKVLSSSETTGKSIDSDDKLILRSSTENAKREHILRTAGALTRKNSKADIFQTPEDRGMRLRQSPRTPKSLPAKITELTHNGTNRKLELKSPENNSSTSMSRSRRSISVGETARTDRKTYCDKTLRKEQKKRGFSALFEDSDEEILNDNKCSPKRFFIEKKNRYCPENFKESSQNNSGLKLNARVGNEGNKKKLIETSKSKRKLVKTPIKNEINLQNISKNKPENEQNFKSKSMVAETYINMSDTTKDSRNKPDLIQNLKNNSLKLCQNLENTSSTEKYSEKDGDTSTNHKLSIYPSDNLITSPSKTLSEEKSSPSPAGSFKSRYMKPNYMKF